MYFVFFPLSRGSNFLPPSLLPTEQNIAASGTVIKLAVLKPRTSNGHATRYLNSNEACREGNRKIGKAFGSKTGMRETGRIKGGSNLDLFRTVVLKKRKCCGPK